MSLKRKLVILLLIALALGLLYPGVTQPVLTLTGTVEKSRIAELGIEMIAGEGADAQTRQMLATISSFLGFDQIEGQLQAYSNTRSIWLCSRNDAIGNVAVMLAATGVLTLGSRWPDLLVATLIASLSLSAAVQVIRHAMSELQLSAVTDSEVSTHLIAETRPR